jgi:predicted Zn finger-like uncharacterized protein
MILTCPECSTRFQVPAESLGEGRTVRCSRCSHRWFQEPEREEAVAAAPEEPVAEGVVEAEDAAPVEEVDAPEPAPDFDEPVDDAEDEPAAEEEDEPDPFADAPPPPAAARAAVRRAAEADDSGGNRLATVLWVVLFLVVAGVVGSAIGFRQVVMTTWPAAEGLYDMVGLGPEPPGAGLGLRNVRWKAGTQGDMTVLRVEGEVANLTDRVRPVPPIEGIIFDKANKELQRWRFTAPEARLLPGENVSFTTELKNPASGASRLQIVFAHPKKAH